MSFTNVSIAWLVLLYISLGSFTRMTGACTRKIDGSVYQAAYFLTYQGTLGFTY